MHDIVSLRSCQLTVRVTVATCKARRVPQSDLQGAGLFVEKNSPSFVCKLESTKIEPYVLKLLYDAV
jgi:hypothetical protein